MSGAYLPKNGVKNIATNKTARKPLKRTNKSIRLIVDSLFEKNARDVLILDVRKISGITDFIIVAGGSSDRQLKTMAENVMSSYKRHPLGHEGLASPGSRWIVLDYGNIMIHLIHDELRAYYNIEGLWPDAKELFVDGPFNEKGKTPA